MELADWGTVALLASAVGGFFLWGGRVVWRYMVRQMSESFDPMLLKIHDRIDSHMKEEEADREALSVAIQETREDVATIAGHVGAQLRPRR